MVSILFFAFIDVDAEAGMAAHYECWGPATTAWPIVYALTVYE